MSVYNYGDDFCVPDADETKLQPSLEDEEKRLVEYYASQRGFTVRDGVVTFTPPLRKRCTENEERRARRRT